MSSIQNVLVLLNARAGNTTSTANDDAESIRKAFASANITATVLAMPASQLTAAATKALNAKDQRFDAIVASGGDGTISAVAAALVGRDVPLGILPTGTLNHFAKDLSLPQDVAAAANVIATGTIRSVDVGQVNDRIFINNSGIGLYPRIVTHRDKQMERLGRGKWLSFLIALLSLFRHIRGLHVRLRLDGRTEMHTTPFLFVGNNNYHIDLFKLGTRTILDAGELCCYFTTRTGRFAVLRLAIRTVLGRLSQSSDFYVINTKELWIDSRRPTLKISADGEVVELQTPLHYRIREAALKVIVPR